MKEKQKLKNIVKPIVKWYQENKRELPWRRDRDPYHIWISEIMLQQTRIEAVKSYYTRFMEELPTIQHLANIQEEKLLKLWEGLGYYSRARNLQKAAKIIVEQYNGKMPTSYVELLKLPGIGEYTAGAIASIAFGEKVPAIDGNVLRVISRILASKNDILLADTKKKIEKKIKPIIPKEAGDFNEGLMEIGELICIPNGEPLCKKCPVKEVCEARKTNQIAEIPVRNKIVKRKKEERVVFILECDHRIAILKRPSKGLLAGMYEFPNILINKKEKLELEKILKGWNLKGKKVEEIGESEHIFSHIEWHMNGIKVEVEKENQDFEWIPLEKIEKEYAIPTAFKKYKNYILQ